MNNETLMDVINPKNIKYSNICKITLEKADFHFEEGNGAKYFDILYRCVASDGTEWLVELPRVTGLLPINDLPTFDVSYSSGIPYSRISMATGSRAWLTPGYTNYIRTTGRTSAASYIVNEPCKEMTLAEVEEKLGYKVKIISEKENNNE